MLYAKKGEMSSVFFAVGNDRDLWLDYFASMEYNVGENQNRKGKCYADH